MALFVLSPCPFDISVGVGAFVIGLSQISSFFSNGSLFRQKQVKCYSLSVEMHSRMPSNINSVIKKKKKKNYFRPTDPNFFQLVTVNTVTYFFLAWSFFREWMFERTKKSPWKVPWKCTSKVLEMSLKKVCHHLWKPWSLSQNGMLHLGEGDFIIFDEIPISTIKLHEGRFQTFPDIPAGEAYIKVAPLSE